MKSTIIKTSRKQKLSDYEIACASKMFTYHVTQRHTSICCKRQPSHGFVRFLNHPSVVLMHVEPEDVESLADVLPDEAFVGLDTQGDRRLIAESIILDIPLLGSRDTNTVIHETLNRWGAAKGYNNKLIHLPSETVFELCDRDIQTACEWVIAFTMNDLEIPKHNLESAFLQTLEVVRTMGLDEGRHLGFDTLVAQCKSYLNRCVNFSRDVQAALDHYGDIRTQVRTIEFELTNLVNDCYQQLDGASIQRAFNGPRREPAQTGLSG